MKTDTLLLPRSDGTLQPFAFRDPVEWQTTARPQWNRVAFAAAHVVSDPRAATDPWLDVALDWDATLAYRRHLWSLGFAVAESMDTAQRGMGLDWPTSLELIRRSASEARLIDGAVMFGGAGTDHLPPHASLSIDDVIAAYEEQCAAVEATGARIILMASRALAAIARSADDYMRVYGRVLSQVKAPVILHWLGEMFDPALAGYWTGRGIHDPDHAQATDVCAAVIAEHRKKIDGIKISLLDDAKEVALRRRLPAGVRMYTGDDFNFAQLIGGDASGHSDALLGIFDAIAPAASAALTALAKGDRARFDAILAPTVPLSRHIFMSPTRFYKTGVVFLAWLNGHQAHFTMVGGQQSARSLTHLVELARLADAAQLILDPELATRRMRSLLAVHGLA
ncbi:MAG TPA: dihydrodipicolinate synthase family protein [Casimicrobiaceae bacterium]|nr:dihydrodipicolinate synthase family protein [Casimicrobiaceae bacterium]